MTYRWVRTHMLKQIVSSWWQGHDLKRVLICEEIEASRLHAGLSYEQCRRVLLPPTCLHVILPSKYINQTLIVPGKQVVQYRDISFAIRIWYWVTPTKSMYTKQLQTFFSKLALMALTSRTILSHFSIYTSVSLCTASLSPPPNSSRGIMLLIKDNDNGVSRFMRDLNHTKTFDQTRVDRFAEITLWKRNFCIWLFK